MSSAKTSVVFAFANTGSVAECPLLQYKLLFGAGVLLPPPTRSGDPRKLFRRRNGGAVHATPLGSRGGKVPEGSVLEQSEQFLFGGSDVVCEPGHEEDV
jgi:hypothetical protein